ncbi:MAG TPA: 5'-methylthioadenosine/adenosylhomocysteine nucleosidase [Firmicutes bacterium]|nr:5'-methylthioadenosine/adenosylhomocysteine nucleosidase [Bacillota bacterium]
MTRKAIGILGAMQVEVEMLITRLKNKQTYEYAGCTYYAGELEGTPVVIATCGIGKVCAACRTQAMLDHFDIRAVINTGIAGGMQPDLSPCDIVISTDVVYHDMYGIEHEELVPAMPADPALRAAAEKACAALDQGKSRYYSGRIASGDQFIADSRMKAEILAAHHPFCVEMEGAAIAHCCTMNQMPFVVIRTISDNADDHAEFNYNAFEVEAANISAAIVCKMLSYHAF